MENIKIFVSLASMLILLPRDFSTDKHSVDRGVQTGTYTLTEAFPRLTFDSPVELTSPEDNTDRVFVVEQKGVIQIFKRAGDPERSTVFLDIENQVSSGGEMG